MNLRILGNHTHAQIDAHLNDHGHEHVSRPTQEHSMAKFELPQTDFEPHPTGRHVGVIANVRDEGLSEGPYGPKHQLSIRIESETAMMEDGEPFIIIHYVTLSGSPKSNLTKFRCAVADRVLTPAELKEPLDDAELIGKRISYRVDHKERQDKSGYRAVLRDGSVEPAAGSTKHEIDMDKPAYNAGDVPLTEPDDQGAPPPSDSDLPF